jgi:ATP phosphoribosyltransferase
MSAAYMQRMGFDLSPIMRPHQRLRIWEVSSQWGKACVLVCSIRDILTNVSNGDIDIGIVSSDAYERWKNTEREAFRRSTMTVHNLGPAGSNLMFGIRADLMDKESATWTQALHYCQDRNLPVVTCDEHVLRGFLRKKKITIGSLRFSQPEGGVEAQGVLQGTPLICDQVETGETMREHGYESISDVEIAQSRVLLIGTLPRQSDRRKIFEAVWRLATAEA